MRRYAKILWAAGALFGLGFGFTGLAQAMPTASLAGVVKASEDPAARGAVPEKAYYHRTYHHYHHNYHYHHYHHRHW